MCCSIFWQFMGGRTKLAEHFGPDLFVFLIQELILFFLLMIHISMKMSKCARLISLNFLIKKLHRCRNCNPQSNELNKLPLDTPLVCVCVCVHACVCACVCVCKCLRLYVVRRTYMLVCVWFE